MAQKAYRRYSFRKPLWETHNRADECTQIQYSCRALFASRGKSCTVSGTEFRARFLLCLYTRSWAASRTTTMWNTLFETETLLTGWCQLSVTVLLNVNFAFVLWYSEGTIYIYSWICMYKCIYLCVCTRAYVYICSACSLGLLLVCCWLVVHREVALPDRQTVKTALLQQKRQPSSAWRAQQQRCFETLFRLVEGLNKPTADRQCRKISKTGDYIFYQWKHQKKHIHTHIYIHNTQKLL